VALLRAALGRGLPTLGVCLGAQLLALAAGGLVYPGADGPEVGWSGVDLLPTCAGDALFAGFPRRLPVLHCMATRSTCPRERNGWRTTRATRTRLSGRARRPGGLQFHLEVTADALGVLLDAFPTDAARAPGGAAAVRETTAASLGALVPWRDLAFDRFAALVAGGHDRPVEGGSRHGFADISES
jgi:GMP synthase-like glutamine amidotransferase